MNKPNLTLATSDLFPFLFLFLAMLGGTLLVVAGVILLNGHLGLSLVLKSAELAIPGLALIGLGLRRRMVWLDEKSGEVLITWGNRCALPIHRYTPGSITTTQVNREQRFMVTSIPSGPTRASRLPDRWRLLGFLQNKKKVNLGSYATEAQAQGVVKQIINEQRTSEIPR